MESKKKQREKNKLKHISANLPRHLVDYLDLLVDSSDLLTNRTQALIKVLSDHKTQNEIINELINSKEKKDK